MKITHSFGDLKIEKEIGGAAAFLLTNRLGDYLSWQTSGGAISRYQGWYTAFGGELFKIIDDLEIDGAPAAQEFTNNFWNVQRKRGEIEENFFLPLESHSLVWEISRKSRVNLVFDVKKSYENNEYGRNYEIFGEKGVVFVRYRDDSGYELWLAVKNEAGLPSFPNQWFPRFYIFDQKRNSWPFERYVSRGLTFDGARTIVISVGKSKKEAAAQVNFVFKKRESLKKKARKEIIEKKTVPEKIRDEEIKMAYLCCRNSLNALLVNAPEKLGVYAGLPWFFQFWSRDEAISLKSLWRQNSKEAKSVIFRLLHSIGSTGRIPVWQGEIERESADAAGWVFQRVGELIRNPESVFSGISFSRKELKEIKEKIVSTATALIGNHTADGFDIAGPNETWMDTLVRAGARIEIQVLRLNLYKLAYELTGDNRWRELESELAFKVRENFWNGEILADGLEDWTVRPNIFIAAYVYPELLTKDEWLKCFESALAKLWLEWGGVATLDKENPTFYWRHSGENNLSYHNGDSWFWLNNLAALVLYKFDAKKLSEFAGKIMEASTEEILWSGVVGHHSELSSAENLSSEGCWAQAWSAALYLEALDEILERG